MFLKHVPGTLKKNLLLHDFTFFTLWVLNPCFGEVRTNNSARARPPWNRIWGYCLFVSETRSRNAEEKPFGAWFYILHYLSFEPMFWWGSYE
jgi:hypothetical protein